MWHSDLSSPCILVSYNMSLRAKHWRGCSLRRWNVAAMPSVSHRRCIDTRSHLVRLRLEIVSFQMTVSASSLPTGTGSDQVLNQAAVPIVNLATCRAWHNQTNHVRDSMVCVGYEDGSQGACYVSIMV